MARDDKVYMPSGMGGLIRYPDEETEVIKLKPKHVVGIVSFVVIFELVLRLLF